MAGQYEVEVTVISGKNLKNVNWKNGDLHPYVCLWLDPAVKLTTKVSVAGEHSGEDPFWDEKIAITLPHGVSIRDAVIYVDVIHAEAGKDTKPLVGSASIALSEIVDRVGLGGNETQTLKLKRPSGRPHGKIEVQIAVKEPSRYYEAPPPAPYGYAPYGAPPPSAYPSYGYGYGAPPPAPVGSYAQSSSMGVYRQPPPMEVYGQPPPVGVYGQPPPVGVYGQPHGGEGEQKKKNKFGMGTGLAVGAAAGVLGGLALAEGVDYLEDEIAEDVAEKVEDDLGYGEGDDF